MRIVLDAMGSDDAPGPEIEGALRASQDSRIEIIMVGDKDILEAELARHPRRSNIRIVHASERIMMNEKPMVAVRKKKNSSMLVGLRLVKTGEADAFVSCGNTGAAMVGARIILMPIKGVSRPALCQTLPTLKRPCVVLDLGATVDCTADQLCQFAEMGSIYSSRVLGAAEPKVGLMNIGEEVAKGNELAKNVHHKLTVAPHINFIGNIEPKALYKGEADVVVSDGFVGNVVLKTSEAVAMFITSLLREQVKSTWTSRLGALFLRGGFNRLKGTIDSNEYPGALLLGVRGTVIILHGSSTEKGVANSIRGAAQAVEADINRHIREAVVELKAAVEKQEAEDAKASLQEEKKKEASG
jgi:glycerol-3-phosphate acyltransferase PlsX